MVCIFTCTPATLSTVLSWVWYHALRRRYYARVRLLRVSTVVGSREGCNSASFVRSTPWVPTGVLELSSVPLSVRFVVFWEGLLDIKSKERGSFPSMSNACGETYIFVALCFCRQAVCTAIYFARQGVCTCLECRLSIHARSSAVCLSDTPLSSQGYHPRRFFLLCGG